MGGFHGFSYKCGVELGKLKTSVRKDGVLTKKSEDLSNKQSNSAKVVRQPKTKWVFNHRHQVEPLQEQYDIVKIGSAASGQILRMMLIPQLLVGRDEGILFYRGYNWL